MKILGLTVKHGEYWDGNGWDACGYHRILLPLSLMEGIGYVTDGIADNDMDGWDAIIYNRVSQYDEIWDKVRERMKCKIIIDIDDCWKLPPNHHLYSGYAQISKRIENNIRNADMVTVTTENLAEKVYKLNKNICILPNALPFGKFQFSKERLFSDKVRIFWAGGISHEHDLSILRNPFNKLLIHKGKIQMVIGGYSDNQGDKPFWNRMVSSVTDYMEMYNHADIMVIPLESSEWHKGKSNLKILEAASKKIPCIVSNVLPYNEDKDTPVLWVNSQKDWFEHLNYLILNPNARIDLGEKLHEWAKEKYSLEKVNLKRYGALLSVCDTPTLTIVQ